MCSPTIIFADALRRPCAGAEFAPLLLAARCVEIALATAFDGVCGRAVSRVRFMGARLSAVILNAEKIAYFVALTAQGKNSLGMPMTIILSMAADGAKVQFSDSPLLQNV
ncbi:hypothetical protein RHS03_07641, partial [Rhizoctonia solani]